MRYHVIGVYESSEGPAWGWWCAEADDAEQARHEIEAAKGAWDCQAYTDEYFVQEADRIITSKPDVVAGPVGMQEG